MLIIKAGGSAITDKGHPYTERRNVMNSLAQQLTQIDEKIILTHGVGSYGHPPAKTFQIGKGYDGTRSRLMGLMITHYWVDELSQTFTRILIDHEIPALRMRPTTMVVTQQRRIVEFNSEPMERFLDMGIVPVLHGDGPADRTQGFCVLSADQLVTFFARRFRARKVIFGMDVPGILDQNQTLSRVTFEDLPEIRKMISDNRDASGGLAQKCAEIETLKGTGIEIQLISLLQPGTLLAAVRDEDVGTKIIS